MASNNRVHDFANDIRINVDKESTGIRVYASDTNRAGFLGKIVIGAGSYRIKAFIDSGDNFSVRIAGRRPAMKRIRCREIMAKLDSLGYVFERDRNVVVSNIAFTRTSIAKLAVDLAA
jgi:hypothetical protein